MAAEGFGRVKVISTQRMKEISGNIQLVLLPGDDIIKLTNFINKYRIPSKTECERNDFTFELLLRGSIIQWYTNGLKFSKGIGTYIRVHALGYVFVSNRNLRRKSVSRAKPRTQLSQWAHSHIKRLSDSPQDILDQIITDSRMCEKAYQLISLQPVLHNFGTETKDIAVNELADELQSQSDCWD